MELIRSRATRCTTASATFHPADLGTLTVGEQREWATLPTEERRADWLCGRVAAKRAVGEHLSIADLRRLALHRRDASAPACSDRVLGPLPVVLSIAHAHGHAVAAAAAPRDRVGVDLEREGAIRAAYVRFFASCDERRRMRFVDATTHWVLKEAAWKAFRCPPRLPLTALELWCDAHRALCAVSIAGARHAARAWVTRPWPGFVAAVVLAPMEVM